MVDPKHTVLTHVEVRRLDYKIIFPKISTVAPWRLDKSIRLDLCLNFDQVWRSNWSNPKKVLTRTAVTDAATSLIAGKRQKIWEELQKLQSQEVDWTAKRRRIAGGKVIFCF